MHGPYGELDNQQLFLQKVIPDTNTLFVRLCSTGDRVCKIQSVDGSTISSFYVHECEALGRLGYRPRKFVFTGHTNGSIQVWDLTQTLNHLYENPSFNQEQSTGGPTQEELLDLLQQCDVSASRTSSRITSLNGSPSPSYLNLKRPYAHHASTPNIQRATSLHSLPVVTGSPSVAVTTASKKLPVNHSNLPQAYSSSNSSISNEENEFIIRVRSDVKPQLSVASDSPLLVSDFTHAPGSAMVISELPPLTSDPSSPSQIYGEVSEITPTETNSTTTFDFIENEGEFNV